MTANLPSARPKPFRHQGLSYGFRTRAERPMTMGYLKMMTKPFF